MIATALLLLGTHSMSFSVHTNSYHYRHRTYGYTLDSSLKQKYNIARNKRSQLRLIDNLFENDFGGNVISTIETFDGSLVNPVVVSNVFWAALQAKFISLLIGQFIASIVFASLSSFIVSTIAKVFGSFISSQPPVGSNPGKKEPFRTGSSNRQVASSMEESQITFTVPRNIDLSKLFISLIIDIIGTSSELIPIVGEISDVAWAPLAGYILKSLYGSDVVLILEVVEEILPFTDFLPLATICWSIETFAPKSDIAKALQIGVFGSQTVNDNQKSSESNVIDVEARNADIKRINPKR